MPAITTSDIADYVYTYVSAAQVKLFDMDMVDNSHSFVEEIICRMLFCYMIQARLLLLEAY